MRPPKGRLVIVSPLRDTASPNTIDSPTATASASPGALTCCASSSAEDIAPRCTAELLEVRGIPVLCRENAVKRRRLQVSSDSSGSDTFTFVVAPDVVEDTSSQVAPNDEGAEETSAETQDQDVGGSTGAEAHGPLLLDLMAQPAGQAVSSGAVTWAADMTMPTTTSTAETAAGAALESDSPAPRNRRRRRSRTRSGSRRRASATSDSGKLWVVALSESDSEDLETKHERFVRRVQRQRPLSGRHALWAAQVEGEALAAQGAEEEEEEEGETTPGECCLSDVCSLRQLRRPPRLLRKHIRFQGQMVTLHELLVSQPHLAEALTGDALAHLLRAEEPRAGPPPPPAPHCYVQRPLARAARASRALLSALATAAPATGVVLAVSGVSTQKLQEVLPPGCRAEQLCLRAIQPPENLKFVSINHDTAEESLTYLGSLPCVRSVHWFHMDPDTSTLHWRRSSPGALEFIRPFLEAQADQFSPSELEERVVLVVGKPGLGKSTLVSSLAQTIKERDPMSWVVRVNLNTYSSFLEKEEINERTTVDLLLNATFQSDRPNPFEEKFFRHCVTESGKTTVFVDGFDEVCFRHMDRALKLLEHIEKTKVQQIWVTSREVLKEILETKLSTLSFTLAGFDGASQRKFFKAFWQKNMSCVPISRLEKFIHEFLKALKLSNVSRHGMQIPLEAMMMAEAFQPQAELFCRGEGLDLALPTRVDLMDLYRRFVLNKYAIKLRKEAVESARAGFEHTFRVLAEEYTRGHQLLALAFLFPEAQLRQLQPPDVAERAMAMVRAEGADANLEKVGIVTRVEAGVPRFVHRTFAEYFAALWLAEHFTDNRDFLEDNLFAPEHSDLRFMFDRLLARDSEIHRSTLFGDRRGVVACLEGSRECTRRRDRGGRAPLHMAAAYGRADLVQPLASAGADLDQRDAMFAWTPLEYAQRADAWDAAEALLVAGADSAPLAAALGKLSQTDFVVTCARGGHIKLLQYAVDAGAAHLGSAVSPCGRCALHVACEAGQSLAVELLLGAGLGAGCADRDGTTPLHLAAARGHTQVVRRLLGCGADVHATDALRSSPLLVAAAEGHLTTVRTLVESGADVNLAGPLGTTPLHWACARGFKEVVVFLLEAQADARALDAERCSPLHEAAGGGHVGAVQALLGAGADPLATDADGLTPLHAAAQRGYAQAVELLAKAAPASVHARDLRGRRPVHLAAAGAHTAAVHALAEAGADLLVTDGDGVLPLHLAARAGHVDLLRLLLDAGCSVDARDSRDQTPLHHAVAAGREEAIVFLAEANANVSATDNRGWSPVHVAVRHGHVKALNILYEQGAFVNQEALCGTTPLHLAADAGHHEMVRFLVECGADVNRADKQGRRPVHLAAARGLAETTDYLLAAGADTRLPDSQAGDRPGEDDSSDLDFFDAEFDSSGNTT